MKIFRSKAGRIFQLADKEKIQNWDAEMPLIFIGFVREKQLDLYPKGIRTQVEKYLDEILEDIAIPKLMTALKSNNAEERLKVAENLLEISQKNADQLKIALPHIENALNDPNKKVAKTVANILKNYKKEQLKKKNAAKRKKLTQLRKQMDKIDTDFADGKISDADYIKEQKNFLKLKREIELSEQLE